MKQLLKFLLKPVVVWFLMSGAVLFGMALLRGKGLLQRPDFIVYDRMVNMRVDQSLREDRIVICGMTEDDLVKYGYPISDAHLAVILERLVAADPCVIGLDIYRDLKEPRQGGAGNESLERVLLGDPRILAIERLGGVGPPPALADKPGRVAPNNFPLDRQVDGLYRRAVLQFDWSQPSFALELTKHFLKRAQVEVKEEGGLLKLGATVFPPLTRNSGAYEGLSDFKKLRAGTKLEDYQIMIDFKGPRTFATVTFGDVLEGRVDPADLRGKIVLVASIMESVKDDNPTPVENRLRGVNQHAMVVNQLLRSAIDGEKPMTWWSQTAELCWIGFWSLMGGMVGLGCRSPWRLIPCLVAFVGLIWWVGWWLFTSAVWIPVMAPMLGCSLSAALVTSFVVYMERSDRGAMQALFSRHVSGDVVNALWADREQFLDGGRLKPQRVTATVLFTDLKGFSTISEGMEPEPLMTWMNEYMEGVAGQVEAHGGMINKYIGDAIMAVFGVPIARHSESEIEEDAINAVKCALAMREALARLNAEWQAKGLPTTSMRVGIQTGPLVSGSFGSQARLEFTVLGDTVNTAARLESAGKDLPEDPLSGGCMILIGESTYRRLRGLFKTSCLGPIGLKGKSDKTIVHSVISAI